MYAYLWPILLALWLSLGMPGAFTYQDEVTGEELSVTANTVPGEDGVKLQSFTINDDGLVTPTD